MVLRWLTRNYNWAHTQLLQPSNTRSNIHILFIYLWWFTNITSRTLIIDSDRSIVQNDVKWTSNDFQAINILSRGENLIQNLKKSYKI